jgi:hypothetical protein
MTGAARCSRLRAALNQVAVGHDHDARRKGASRQRQAQIRPYPRRLAGRDPLWAEC